jgi:hypothetical protein
VEHGDFSPRRARRPRRTRRGAGNEEPTNTAVGGLLATAEIDRPGTFAVTRALVRSAARLPAELASADPERVVDVVVAIDNDFCCYLPTTVVAARTPARVGVCSK